MEIKYISAIDLAQMLINNEVTLSQLKSISTFAPKADLTEDAVWENCKNSKEYKRYIAIYPNGRHKNEVEEHLWLKAVEKNELSYYMDYWNSYPQGIHATEVDDRIFELVKSNGAIQYYLNFFPAGNHASEAKEILETNKKDEDAWIDAQRANTVEAYQLYKENYKLHITEANKCISDLQIGIKEALINNLSLNRNAYRIGYLKNCGITQEDLRGRIKDSRGKIRDDVLLSWDKTLVNLSMGASPDEIEPGVTEVYFWGIPSSGKTCAMAAILSMANRMSCFEPREGEGLAYMTELATTFMDDSSSPAVALPKGSDVETTQYLPLNLNEYTGKNNDKIKTHKLALVEISGEIFECFAYDLQKRKFPTDRHEKTYEQLKSYLYSKTNPKYHFFILDSQPEQNSNQTVFLQQAALYLQSRNIFNNTTQGISLIVTKSDTLSPDRDKWGECATTSVEKNFGSLLTTLKKIVGPNGLGLSNGRVRVIPLSIGEVFFKTLCIFDPEPARELVELLIEYANTSEKDPRWRKILNK